MPSNFSDIHHPVGELRESQSIGCISDATREKRYTCAYEKKSTVCRLVSLLFCWRRFRDRSIEDRLGKEVRTVLVDRATQRTEGIVPPVWNVNECDSLNEKNTLLWIPSS